MTMDSNEQQELDPIARLHAEKLELEREGYLPIEAGRSETDVLASMTLRAFAWGWVGIALSGGVLGTFMAPLLGTLLGLAFAGLSAAVPCLLTFLLYAMSRGRVPPKFAITWAGAMAGVGCFALLASGRGAWPVWAVAGMFGAVGGRVASNFPRRRYKVTEGSEIRKRHQFTILDLMLLTAWLAIFLTILQIGTRIAEWSWPTTWTSVAVSLACAAVVEIISHQVAADQSIR